MRSLRYLASWSSSELGLRVGVSKQTVSNLETGKTKMSLMQYLAIRTVLDESLDCEIGNPILEDAIFFLIDIEPEDNMNPDEYEAIKSTICMESVAAAGEISGEMLNDTFHRLVATLPQYKLYEKIRQKRFEEGSGHES